MKTQIITSAALGLATVLMTVSPAFAQVKPAVKPLGVTTRTHVASSTTTAERQAQKQEKAQQQITTQQERGVKEITNRIDALNKLATRIQGMKNLTDAQKASFAATVQGEIATLTALQQKIQADTSTTTLKTDLKTIAPDYRVYMLIMPQISIMSGVDRVNSLVTSLTTIEGKIQARVAATSSLSNNTAIKTALADMTAKLADASSKASAAETEVANLKPDQGDKTIQASNLAALKDARKKLQAAQQDVVTARKDARTAVDLIKSTDKTLVKDLKEKAPRATTTKTSGN